jgi:glyoxylase-like metal-dependent hydrolase (beta-lactamase superfamily II)
MAVVRQVDVGLLANLVTIFAEPSSQVCAVVDPAFEVDRIAAAAQALCGGRSIDQCVAAILITHTHHDHVDGLEEMVRRTGAPTFVHASEADRIAHRVAAAGGTLTTLDDGAQVSVGNVALEVLHTPGHTQGALCYLGGRDASSGPSLICGDTLFVGGCGRADLQPGGDVEQLWSSLRRLGVLAEETRIYPGHDYGETPTSTIGWEAVTNPYVRCALEGTLEDFRRLRMAPRLRKRET